MKKKLKAYEETYKEDIFSLSEKIKELKGENDKIKENLKFDYEKKMDNIQNNLNEKLIEKNKIINDLIENKSILEKKFGIIYGEKQSLEEINAILKEENENFEELKFQFDEIIKLKSNKEKFNLKDVN